MTRPTVPEVRPLVRALFRRHSAGCCWHVVLDDRNVKKAFVEDCAVQAAENGHPECVALIEPLRLMSKTQLLKLTFFIDEAGSTP